MALTTCVSSSCSECKRVKCDNVLISLLIMDVLPHVFKPMARQQSTTRTSVWGNQREGVQTALSGDPKFIAHRDSREAKRTVGFAERVVSVWCDFRVGENKAYADAVADAISGARAKKSQYVDHVVTKVCAQRSWVDAVHI